MTYKHISISSLLLLLLTLLLVNPVYAQKKRKKNKKKKNEDKNINIIENKEQTKPNSPETDEKNKPKKKNQAKAKPKKDNKPKRKRSKLSEEDDKRVQKLFFEGLTAKIKEDSEAALESFNECLKIDPYNDASMYELSKIYFDKQDKVKSLDYARAAVGVDPQNKWYQFLYAEVLALNTQFEEAAEVYETLINMYPADYEYYFDWGYMLIQSGQYAKAIEAYDLLEEKIGVTENVSIQKQRLYVQLDDLPSAVKELEKLIDTQPKQWKHYETLAELYEINGMPEKSKVLYERMIELDPNSPYGHLALADYYRRKGEVKQSLDQFKFVLQNSNFPLQLKVQAFAPFIEILSSDENYKDQIFELAEVIKKTHSEEALAHALYGDLLYSNGKKTEALKAFQKAAQLDKTRFEVWRQLMFIEYELEDFAGLVEDSKIAIQLFPNQAINYFYNGFAHNMLRDHEAAVKSLKKGVLMTGENEELSFQMYSQLGDAYQQLKKYDKSGKNYEKALKLRPDAAVLLNNYSYYLSLRGDRLEKAAEMSQKSNELEPNNSSFQDTYAWILFKQNKYQDAKKWLEKSITNGGENSATILEHYGDVLFKLNEIDKAVRQWQIAKEKGGDATTLDKKINERKLHE